MALKFYASLAKGLKLKVRKCFGLTPTFVEVTWEKLVNGVFLHPPPSSLIGLSLTFNQQLNSCFTKSIFTWTMSPSNENTRTMCQICSKLIIKRQIRSHWDCSGTFRCRWGHSLPSRQYFANTSSLLTLSLYLFIKHSSSAIRIQYKKYYFITSIGLFDWIMLSFIISC